MVPSDHPAKRPYNIWGKILEAQDIILDGSNRKFHDDVRRAADLLKDGIHNINAGTSRGIGEWQIGYRLTVGGKTEPVCWLAPILTTLAPENGWTHVGGHGAEHYVKMVHNGIEYSMMQGRAEDFVLMSKSDYKLNLAGIADLRMHGSVVRP